MSSPEEKTERKPLWERYFPMLLTIPTIGNFAVMWWATSGTWLTAVGLFLNATVLMYAIAVQREAISKRPQDYPRWHNGA